MDKKDKIIQRTDPETNEIRYATWEWYFGNWYYYFHKNTTKEKATRLTQRRAKQYTESKNSQKPKDPDKNVMFKYSFKLIAVDDSPEKKKCEKIPFSLIDNLDQEYILNLAAIRHIESYSKNTLKNTRTFISLYATERTRKDTYILMKETMEEVNDIIEKQLNENKK